MEYLKKPVTRHRQYGQCKFAWCAQQHDRILHRHMLKVLQTNTVLVTRWSRLQQSWISRRFSSSTLWISAGRHVPARLPIWDSHRVCTDTSGGSPGFTGPFAVFFRTLQHLVRHVELLAFLTRSTLPLWHIVIV